MPAAGLMKPDCAAKLRGHLTLTAVSKYQSVKDAFIFIIEAVWLKSLEWTDEDWDAVNPRMTGPFYLLDKLLAGNLEDNVKRIR